MVVNEEDDRVQARRDLGLSRELQQDKTSLSDPAIRGGCSGYPVWFRLQELAKWQAGEEMRTSVSSLVRRSKKASTEAYQAFTPRNILREALLFTRGLPPGIFEEVPRRTLVDFNECGVSLDRTNRRNKNGVVKLRIRKPGITQETRS
jgi:hypothetical protein